MRPEHLWDVVRQKACNGWTLYDKGGTMSEHVNPLMLEPVPGLEFFPGPHRYRMNGLWVPHSVTQVSELRHAPKQAMGDRANHGRPRWMGGQGHRLPQGLGPISGIYEASKRPA